MEHRKQRWKPALVAVLATCGCGGGTGGADPADQAVPLDLGAPADLTPHVVSYSAKLIVEDVALQRPAGDGGAGAPVRLILPLLGFESSDDPPPEYSDPGFLGCVARHFDNGVLPLPRAGQVTLSGLRSGLFLDGTPAPTEIRCDWEPTGLFYTAYRCRYGASPDGGAGPDVRTAYLLPDPDPIATDDVLRFRGTGDQMFGAFDSLGAFPPAPEPVVITDDLGALRYSPSSDTEIHYACTGGTLPTDGGDGDSRCAFGVLVQVIFSKLEPGDPDFPGQVIGWVGRCVNVGATGVVTVKKEAVAAALGQETGYRTAQTLVLHGRATASLTDSRGNPILVTVFRGVSGYAAIP